jgi:hypothetical protein
MKAQDLKKHIFATYFALRIGIAVLSVALPLVLWIGGNLDPANGKLLDSMSAYYHSGAAWLRDIFVGILFAVGAFLYLYKGYTFFENYALNAAGLLLVGVALFPTPLKGKIGFHHIFAVSFFLAVAYVCFFRAWDTLGLIKNKASANQYKYKILYKLTANQYKIAYKLIGVGLIVSPGFAILLSFILKPYPESGSTIFFAELFGIFVFAVYWVLKSFEIYYSNVEKSAIEGKLELSIPAYGLKDLFKQIAVQESTVKEPDLPLPDEKTGEPGSDPESSTLPDNY